MAVSNSTDFSLVASDLVVEARRRIGIHADEEPLAAADLQSGLRQLNMMLKAWQAEGIGYWLSTEGQLSLVQGQASYVFGSGGAFTTVPFDLQQVRILRNSNEIEMFEISREDYYRLPVKTTQGYPTQWFYDRQRSNGTLYVWPTPDATAGTLKFTYRRSIMDMDTTSDDMDLPQEWYEAIVLNLAVRIGGPDWVDDNLRAEAVNAYTIVKTFDVGEGIGSISILPTQDWRYRGR